MPPVKKTMSAMAALRANPALRKVMDKSKTTPPGGLKYEGPDADLVCRLASHRVDKKKDKDGSYDYAILEFRVLGDHPGQDEYANQKATLFFQFTDNARGSMEDNLGYYFEAISKCGVDTSASDEELDTAVNLLITEKTPIIVVGKWKGEHLNFFVKEPLEPPTTKGSTATNTVTGTVAAADEEVVTWALLGQDADNGVQDAIDQLEAAAAEAGLDSTDGDTYPSWEALGAALDDLGGAAEETVEDAGEVPSMFDGFTASYDSTSGYWVANPNDEAGTLDLIDENSEVVYEGIELSDEYLVIDK
jgi:hypothetical protein